MESDNKSESGNSPRALPVVTSGEAESDHSRKSSSSSSSSSSGLVIGVEDVIQAAASEHEENAQLDSDNANDDFCDSSAHLYEPHSSDSSPAQSPPGQGMERPPESPASAAYRIPSSVFARNKSTAPMEWSVTSNESLFSIHMGNMSFAKDHVNWVGKSGELNYQGDSNLPSPMAGPRIDMSSNQPPTPSKQSPKKKSAELEQKNAGGVTETQAAETMKEVIKENEDKDCKEKTPKPSPPCNSPSLNRSSDASGGSTKSFAFPILTDGKSSKHAKIHASSQPQTPKVANQSPTEGNSQTQQTQAPKPENAGNKSGFECKWLSCFPCCPKCSGTTG